MGMIMKDGIPYGGIYPIDDAPTQGSNNAVKSGGVHSALSNKVDKVAGKGLSTNDYDDTEKEQNAANADAIEAIVNKYGSKNLLKIVRHIDNGYNFNGVVITFNDDNSITCVGRSIGAISLQISDNIYLDPNKQYIISGNTTGSSSTYFLQYSNNRDSAISVKTEERVFTPYNYTTYPNQTAYIQIASGVDINTTFYPMIRDANIKDSTYVPYAMTNLDLTKMFESYKPSLSANAGTGSSIVAYRVGRLVTVNVKWVIIGQRIEITGLPAMASSAELNNGFGIVARDQNDGSLARMWTNGSSDILVSSDPYTTGHAYGISYSYLTD